MGATVLSDGSSNRHLAWIDTPLGLANFGFCTDETGRVLLLSLRTDVVLSSIIGDSCKEKWFLDRLKVCKTAQEYADEMQSIVDFLTPKSDIKGVRIGPPFGQWVCNAIAAVGYEKLVHVESDFSSLTLRFFDSAGRVHEYSIHFPTQRCDARPELSANLPSPLHFHWRADGTPTCIRDIADAVENEIKRLEPYFQVLDDIDEGLHVLEPLHPTYATCFRRLAIDKTCSVTISLNPLNPTDVCDMTFMGPTAITAELRQSLGRNISQWSQSRNIVSNIQNVLGVSLASKSMKEGTSDENDGNECGICYSFECPDEAGGTGEPSTHQAGAAPDVICSNEKCARGYHRSCLVGWLQSVPSSRSSFGTLFGVCPYCSERISVKAIC